MDNLRDYLLMSKFTMDTDNDPLPYIKDSKLGVAQIQWLSKLALCDFGIKYRTGKSNQAADAISHCPKSISDDSSDSDSEEYKTIWYVVICNYLSKIITGEKLLLDIKTAI